MAEQTYTEWLTETFCNTTKLLMDKGMDEENAKAAAKVLMNEAVDVVKGNKLLVDVIANMKEIK